MKLRQQEKNTNRFAYIRARSEVPTGSGSQPHVTDDACPARTASVRSTCVHRWAHARRRAAAAAAEAEPRGRLVESLRHRRSSGEQSVGSSTAARRSPAVADKSLVVVVVVDHVDGPRTGRHRVRPADSRLYVRRRRRSRLAVAVAVAVRSTNAAPQRTTAIGCGRSYVSRVRDVSLDGRGDITWGSEKWIYCPEPSELVFVERGGGGGGGACSPLLRCRRPRRQRSDDGYPRGRS